jgi:hypothetical protein
MITREELIEQLRPFCDIGGQDPRVTESGGKLTLKMMRDARQLKLIIDSDTGKVQSTSGTGAAKYHASLSSLLASDVIANLARWADAQRDLLRRDSPRESKLIPIAGETHAGIEVRSLEDIDGLINSQARSGDSTEILLIDGPAGIGKTTLIENIALKRAESYKANGQPLILHVKSRGRVLSNLQDLMAFSLQTLRSSITYDQLPILVKHGLIILAIDGFDELADPNGYESAWGQVGELVSMVRGRGTLILSGRDTFISRERLVRDVKAIKGSDVVVGLTLSGPTPRQAEEWLTRVHQWTSASFSLPAVSSLFEEDSFALRPVFLKILGEFVRPKSIRDKPDGFLTPLLVRLMAEREAKLFGDAARAALGDEGLFNYVIEFMHEVARDMADSQTEALDPSTLLWLSEAALGSGFPNDIASLIANRSSVISFLINDDRPGFKAFMHSHLQSYFLARVAAKAISSGDIPKFVRRNILGSEFLTVFGDVAAQLHAESAFDVDTFVRESIRVSQKQGQLDRGMRNVAALVLAVTPLLSKDSKVTLVDYQVDESVIRGTSANCVLEGVVINQLDVRGADIRLITFSRCSVLHLVADESTVLPDSFPSPKLLTVGNVREYAELPEIDLWIDSHGRSVGLVNETQIVTERLKAHSAYKLLSKACRFRQYWLRTIGDEHAARVLDDPLWETVAAALRKYDFIREEDRPASGRPSTFVHIKHRDRILAEDPEDNILRDFFKYLDQQLF